MPSGSPPPAVYRSGDVCSAAGYRDPGGFYLAVQPQSITRSMPVTQRASSDAR